ncbi:phosphatase PAP2 family protein [Faecalispora anaeroviscerum]|uniref:phosphatase PAP2 family protein n=1 Tax=Faecalispora anaeroviscerum TaxID=2991836 RepID=UPI0024BB5223|nr:phosphatase PAP2 family protein [Faecalispora anaeroviscerum]
MKKSNRINFTVTGALFSLFVMLTIMLMYVDVKPIGPEDSCVGFATVNRWVSELLGVNMLLYHITDWFGVVAILFALGFAVLGLIQLIARKSLKRVDHSILVLGAFYLLVIAAYVFFEFNIVNYRPVLIQNVLEASYPSSTTMLVLCVMPTAIMQFNRLIKRRTARITVNIVSAVFAVLAVVGRVLSGVHWFTDILGGALLSSALVMLYYSVNIFIESKKPL